MEEKLNITLKIADYPISLKVNRQEEEVYRRSAKLAQETYEKYFKALPDKSKDYLLLLSLLDLSKNHIELVDQKNDTMLLLEVSDISNELKSYLENS